MYKSLLLNADYKPLHFITDYDAICMFYLGKAEVVAGPTGVLSQWDEYWNSPSVSIKVPAVLRLLKYIKKKRHLVPRFRKKAIFYRDGWQCQFCGIKLHKDSISIDHIVPSSRGGKTSWLNCVSSCLDCNRKKANKIPNEVGMKLLRKPYIPANNFIEAMSVPVWHPDWDMWVKGETLTTTTYSCLIP